MHLCNILKFLVLLFIPFYFLYLLENWILINQRNRPQYQLVQAVCAFFDRGSREGTNFFLNVYLVFMSVCFVIYFVSGLIW